MSKTLVCPVCSPARELRALNSPAEVDPAGPGAFPHLALRVPLRRCDGCRGVWTDAETVSVAKAHYHPTHYVMIEGHGRQSCRGCARLLTELTARCSQCGREQRIQCAQCERPMAQLQITKITLDVCRPCRAVWFDRGELGIVVERHAAELRRHLESPRVASQNSDATLQTALDVASLPVDVIEVVDVAGAAGNTALEAGTDVAEFAGEAAGFVLELIAGIFD
jgi:Zn-finger nucleic acid-binding protein